MKESRETTAGINIPIMKRTLKLQNDISRIETTVPEDDKDETYTDLKLIQQSEFQNPDHSFERTSLLVNGKSFIS